MTSFIKSGMDIIVAIDRIDCFLKSLNIQPVLNYKNVEYELELEGYKCLNIKLMPEEIILQTQINPERATQNSLIYKKIEKFIISLDASS